MTQLIPTLTNDFLQWFGGSVVTDTTGGPLVVYHGTSSDFLQFRSGPTFFSSVDVCAYEYGELRCDEEGSGTTRVIAAALNIRAPLLVNAQFHDWKAVPFRGRLLSTNNIAAIAEGERCDGVIFRNLRDSVHYARSAGTVFTVFSPTQVWIVDPCHFV